MRSAAVTIKMGSWPETASNVPFMENTKDVKNGDTLKAFVGLLYPSDVADEGLGAALGGRRIIKTKPRTTKI